MDHYSEQIHRLSRLQDRIKDRKGLVACGGDYSMALHSHGQVLFTGADRFGQSGLTECSLFGSIHCDKNRAIGLRRDGTLCLCGQATRTDHVFRELSHVRTVTCGGGNTAALLGNGRVVAVLGDAWADTSEWPTVTDVVCGKDFAVGLTRDGRLVAVGNHRRLLPILRRKQRIAGIFTDTEGRELYAITDEGRLLSSHRLPRRVDEWRNLVFAAANRHHVWGITAGGELLSTSLLRRSFPENCHYIACAVSPTHTVALTRDGLVLAAGGNEFGQCKTSSLGALFSYFDEYSAQRRGQERMLREEARTYLIHQTEALRYRSRLLCGRRVTACITADGRVLATGGFSQSHDWSRVRALAGGNAHLVALHEDGRVSAAGNDTEHCLAVEDWRNVKAIAAGKYHTLGVTEDGHVLYCGRNHKGQGDVTEWTGIRSVCASDTYTVGVGYDGRIRLAGTPPFDPATMEQWWPNPTQVAVSSTHMAALYPDGRVLTTQPISVPDRHGESELWSTCDWEQVTEIVVGEGFTAGLCVGGRVVAVDQNGKSLWDLSEWEQIVSISGGWHYLAGLTAGGEVLLAGNLSVSKDISATASASSLLPPHQWQDVLCLSCGPHHLAAITRNGHVLAYGSDGENRSSAATHFTAFRDRRQLYGYGQYSQRLEEELYARHTVTEAEDPPTKEESILPFKRFSGYLRAAAETLRCRLRGDDDLLCMTVADGETLAYNYHTREVCRLDAPYGFVPEEEPQVEFAGAVEVRSSGRHTVALFPDGHVEAVGENSYGECAVEGWKRVIQIAVLPRLTMGLCADGTLLRVGRYQEELTFTEPVRAIAGLGRTRLAFVLADGRVFVHKKGSEHPPVPIKGISLFDPMADSVLNRYLPDGDPTLTAKAARGCFAVGMGHILTLGEGGSILAVGANDQGQSDLQNHGVGVTVAAGPYRSAAITPEGKLILTGRNTDGESDYATLNRELEGSRMASDEGRQSASSVTAMSYAWRGVACGHRHTVALRSDGRVYAIGYNPDGRCDTRTWRGVTEITCGVSHTVAVTQQGSCLAVGNNRYGQCDVGQWQGITMVAAGEYHTVALQRDGRVVAVGDNRNGQCRVEDLEHIVSVACLPEGTLCVRADGRVVIRGGSGELDEAVKSLRDVVAIHTCEHRIVALTADRRLICIPEMYVHT